MRWTNREVRNILRLLRRPHALERERLVVMLRDSAHARDGREALLQAINTAFDHSDPQQLQRYETIRRVDMAGETTREAASSMHVSLRQFFRYRSEAIAAIAHSIEQRLRKPPDSHRHLLLLAKAIETIDPKAAREIYLRVPKSFGGQVAYNIVRTALWAGIPVDQEQLDACEGPWRLMSMAAIARHLIALGRDRESVAIRTDVRTQLEGCSGAIYDAVAFELAAQDILDAYRRGDVSRARAITEDIRSLAGSDEYLVAFAMTIEAQQFVIEGDLTAAALALSDLESLEVHGRDHYIMARAAYCNAMLSLVRGFHEDAFVIANGARPAIAALEAGFGFRAATIAGRAALLAGSPWSPPHDLMEKYPDLWTKPEMEGVIARHMLEADPSAARALAQTALGSARRHGSAVIGAGIQAVIAASLSVEGRVDEAQRLWLDSWEVTLARGDTFALYDMFAIPGAPARDIGLLRLDDSVVEVLQRYLERTVPAYALRRSYGLEAEGRELLRTALQAGIGRPEPHAKVIAKTHKAVAGLKRHDIGGEGARRIGGQTARMAARAAGWLSPPHERQKFQERLLEQWEKVLGLMHSSLGADTRLHA